jgi:hypothetical protein
MISLTRHSGGECVFFCEEVGECVFFCEEVGEDMMQLVMSSRSREPFSLTSSWRSLFPFLFPRLQTAPILSGPASRRCQLRQIASSLSFPCLCNKIRTNKWERFLRKRFFVGFCPSPLFVYLLSYHAFIGLSTQLL